MKNWQVYIVITVVAFVVVYGGGSLLLAYHPEMHTEVRDGCVVEFEKDMAGEHEVDRVCP